MIVFDLRCEGNHVFEAWFQNSSAFEDQAQEGQVECPFCGSTDIVKSLMSPNIPAKSNRTTEIQPETHRETHPETYPETRPEFISADHVVSASANVPETMETSAEDVKRALQHMHDTMQKYRNHVKKECEYVGDNFADEARAIHDGTADNRGIYGEATLEETEDLLNEGVDILPVPGLGKLDS